MYAQWEENIKPIADTTITLDTTSYTYNGEAQTPSVTIKDGETTLIEGTDYTLACSNNTNVGTATVTITGIGKYKETAIKTYTITPKEVTVTAVDQTVVGEATLNTGTDYATLENQVSGHTLSAVTLTQSTINAGTELDMYEETITPSAAIIQDASGNDVTSNYSITYKTGTLTVIRSVSVYVTLSPTTITLTRGTSGTIIATVTVGGIPSDFKVDATLSIEQGPSWATLSGNTITVSPPTDTPSGAYRIEVMCSCYGNSATATATVNVTAPATPK